VNTLRVSLQVVAAAETFATKLALVGFLASVSPHMLAIVFLGKELFTTVLTSVRFDLQMHPFLVVDECGVCFESCTTISAEVGLEITVDRGKVYPQCCTSIKLFPTDIARKCFFS